MAEQSRILTAHVIVDGVPSELTLSPDGILRWRADSGREEGSIVIEKELLGIEVEEKTRRTITIKTLVLDDHGEWASGICCCWSGGGGGREGERVRRDVVVEMQDDDDVDDLVVVWAEKIREVINSLGRPRRLFVILNPFGGKKSAKSIFDNQIKPLLAAAGIDYALQETKYLLHAQELAYNLDLLEYDGIVCVSGDGVLVEVLNGLLRRDDWKSAIKMPLGIIPAGTGNGMVKSILNSVGDVCLVSNAVFTVIQGHKRELDIATVSQGQTLFFSLLMLSWGLIADIDIESEKFRWMGSARLEIFPLLRIVNLRKYNGSITFVPAPGCETHGDPIELDNNLELVNEGHEETAQLNGYQGPKLSFKNSDWRMIEGPFVTIWLHNVPWSNSEVMAAPDAKFSDGYFDMVIIKDCPRAALMGLLLKTKDGSHVKSPHVVYLKVKAFRLEPGELVGNPEQGGIIDSDGEVLARGKGTYKSNSQTDPMAYGPPIEMQVEQGLATIFAPRYNN